MGGYTNTSVGEIHHVALGGRFDNRILVDGDYN